MSTPFYHRNSDIQVHDSNHFSLIDCPYLQSVRFESGDRDNIFINWVPFEGGNAYATPYLTRTIPIKEEVLNLLIPLGFR